MFCVSGFCQAKWFSSEKKCLNSHLHAFCFNRVVHYSIYAKYFQHLNGGTYKISECKKSVASMATTFSLKRFLLQPKSICCLEKGLSGAQMYVVQTEDPFVERIFSFKFVGKSQFFFLCRRINHSWIFIQRTYGLSFLFKHFDITW